MDDEIAYILLGWAAVFIGGSLMILSLIVGAVLGGLLATLLASAGILILLYAFLRWRLPEIIKFFKNKEWENEWTRSLGL